MNYTQTFFSFPIKIYSPFVIQKALKQEEITDEEAELDYVVGNMSIHVANIIAWNDSFHRGTSLEEVGKNGFTCTLIQTTQGDYSCLWKREKFEKKLNEFVDTLKKMVEEDDSHLPQSKVKVIAHI